VSPSLREPAARGRPAAPIHGEEVVMASTITVLTIALLLAIVVIDRLAR
jgi:hypothetical protein